MKKIMYIIVMALMLTIISSEQKLDAKTISFDEIKYKTFIYYNLEDNYVKRFYEGYSLKEYLPVKKVKEIKNNLETIRNDSQAKIENFDCFNVDIRIYPNPASSYFNVSLNSDDDIKEVKIEIIDKLGRTIRVYNREGLKGKNKVRIDLSGVEKGSYIVRAAIGSAMKTAKLIVY